VKVILEKHSTSAGSENNYLKWPILKTAWEVVKIVMAMSNWHLSFIRRGTFDKKVYFTEPATSQKKLSDDGESTTQDLKHCEERTFLFPISWNLPMFFTQSREIYWCFSSLVQENQRLQHICSQVWEICTDFQKSNVLNQVRTLLHCKLNFSITCKEFYDKMKDTIKFPINVHYSEKCAARVQTLTSIQRGTVRYQKGKFINNYNFTDILITRKVKVTAVSTTMAKRSGTQRV